MEVYEVNGSTYQNKDVAEDKFKEVAIKYYKANPLDDVTLEKFDNGNKQYVANRELKRSRASIISNFEIIEVLE